MREFSGRPVSPGYGRGPAFVYRGTEGLFERATIATASTPAEELRRVARAIESARHELCGLQSHVEDQPYGTPEGGVLRAQLLMLEDVTLHDGVRRRINAGASAERAVAETVRDVEEALRASRDPYLRERALDVHDVGARLLRQLADRTHHPLASLPSGAVVLAKQLLPSDTIFLDAANVSAMVTEHGGDNSHAAILARSLGIPAVTQVPGIVGACAVGDDVAVDGRRGSVILRPSGAQASAHARRAQGYEASMELARRSAGAQAVTRDGVRIRLLANIGRPEDASGVVEFGADGIGLLRTEFLYLARGGHASEDEQAAAYRDIAAIVGERPIVVRTLDLGPDKILPLDDDLPLACGAARDRGIHLLLRHPELLRSQLRAILRAARAADLRVLLPMVTGVEEIEAVRAMLAELRRDLARAGQDVPEVPLGAMVETMPAVLMAPEIARAADFLSVGSNDLLRFLFAEGRETARGEQRETPYEPSLLRAMDRVVEAARAEGKEVSLCGELAGLPAFTPLLIGLGFRELSMSSQRLLEVRFNVQGVDASREAEVAEEILRLPTAAAVRDALGRDPDPWQRLVDAEQAKGPGAPP